MALGPRPTRRKAAYCARRRLNGAALSPQDMEDLIQAAPLAYLNNVAAKSGDSVSAVVRQAIRNFLDGTDLILGTRRTFDRRFQKRVADMEKNLDRKLEQRLEQIAQRVSESLEEDREKTEYRVRRTVDQALTSFLHRYSQMLDQREAQKKGRGRC